MKGILLLGGHSCRVSPHVLRSSHYHLDCHNQPVFTYPLSVMMRMGIREIRMVCSSAEVSEIRDYLEDGSSLGLRLTYAWCEKPQGITKTLTDAEEWLEGSSVCLVQGDQLIYGQQLTELLRNTARLQTGAEVIACRVKEPERYHVIEFDHALRAVGIEEKPEKPRSTYAMTGLAVYDSEVCRMARDLKSPTGDESEFTGLNRAYLKKGELKVKPLGQGITWMEMGHAESVVVASLFVQTLEDRTSQKIACLEEIALEQGAINASQMEEWIALAGKTEHGRYLRRVMLQYRSAA